MSNETNQENWGLTRGQRKQVDECARIYRVQTVTSTGNPTGLKNEIKRAFDERVEEYEQGIFPNSSSLSSLKEKDKAPKSPVMRAFKRITSSLH